MSDFDHGAWARARSEMALNPPPLNNVIDRLLCGQSFDYSQSDASERLTLDRLEAADLAYRRPHDAAYVCSRLLRIASERGVLDELRPAASREAVEEILRKPE